MLSARKTIWFLTHRTRVAKARRRAFTLIELMVVVAIIGLLTAMVTVAGPVVYETHRKIKTTATMRSVEMAIDQFSELDPLRSTYNSPSRKSFGSYPAYAIFNQEKSNGKSNYIQSVIEPGEPFPQSIGSSNEYTLRGRLARDLFSNSVNVSNLKNSSSGLLSIDDDSTYEKANLQRTYDDMRALYAYLAAYVPDALEAIPESSRLPLTDNEQYSDEGEYFNPTGVQNNLAGRIPILGIVDAWGVPMDYLVMFKLKYTINSDGLAGWTVVDRRPVLRSQGAKYAKIVQIFTNAEDDEEHFPTFPSRDPDERHFGTSEGNHVLRTVARANWIYSQPMPGAAMPINGITDADGELEKLDNVDKPDIYDGWVRCIAGEGSNISDSYGWVPLAETGN